MKIEVALTELRRARLFVAFPHDSYVRPGVGDALISKMAPYLPPLGIMLVSEGAYPRAHASFETRELLPLLATVQLVRFEIDLSQPPEDDDDEELPF